MGFPASQQDCKDICMEPTRLWLHFAHCSQDMVYFLLLTLPLCPHSVFPASQQDYKDICMEPTRLWFKHAPLPATENVRHHSAWSLPGSGSNMPLSQPQKNSVATRLGAYQALVQTCPSYKQCKHASHNLFATGPTLGTSSLGYSPGSG